ncbi:MAG: trigger factor [Alphaproteobacteria bacterium]|nr:trigger factor [Alphaproteobacteria bacterium]
MDVVEKRNEGLSRSFGVLVPMADLGAAVDMAIAEMLPTLRLKGFRPGKVPAAHVRRLYGKGIMGDVVQKTLNEMPQKILAERQLRIAAQPSVTPTSDMDKVLAGQGDLVFDLDVELMPEFEPMDVSTIVLSRPVYLADDAEIDREVERIAMQNRAYEPRSGKAPAAKADDQVLIDFVGRIDGEVFDGGSAEDVPLVIGSGQFIPGFEEQLIGAKAGSDTEVTVAFPDDYGAETLRGKTAVFSVKVKEVRAPKATAVDDALAQQLGLTDLAALREAIREQIDRGYRQASRYKAKRALLDALDAGHDIPLPPGMVEAEFEAIWAQVERDREAGQTAPEDEGKSDEALRAEYRQIAERRVRLGLVLAEIGRRHNVQVTEAELGDAMRAEAMRYGDQAQQIFDLLRNNANAQAQIRAPIYEDKVVDLILGLAQVSDQPVTREALLADDDLPEGFGGKSEDKPAKGGKKAKAAKADGAAKSQPAAAEETPAEEAPKPKTAKAAKPKADADADAKAKPAAKAKAAAPKSAKATKDKPA